MANTVTDQLIRIKTAADSIWLKAADMQLLLPEGSYWDSDSKSLKAITGYSNKIKGNTNNNETYDTADGISSYNFGIDAVASAIDSINIQPYLGLITNSSGNYLTESDFDNNIFKLINCEEKIYIPTGYNIIPFTIKGETLANQTEGTATASHIYKNKTAWINGTEVTGILDTVYLKNPLGSFSQDKVNENNLQVSIKSNWETEDINPADLLDTNIPYRTTLIISSTLGDLNINGTVGVHKNVTLNSYNVYNDGISYEYLKIIPEKGYYDSSWNTNIKYNPTFPNTITISRYTDPDNSDTTILTINSLTIPKGYYSNDIIITPLILDISDNIESVLNYTDINLEGDSNGNYNFTNGIIIFNPETYYTPDSFDYFGTVSLNEATYNIESDGTLNVSKGGWINKAVYGTPYGGLIELLSSDITENISTDIPDVDNINSPKFKITIPQGKRTAAGNVSKVYLVKLGNHLLTNSDDIFKYDNNKFGEEFTYEGQIVLINHLYGKISDIIQSGWINGINTTSYLKISDFTRASNIEKTNDYFKIQNAGWINPLSEWKYVANYVSDIDIFNPINSVSKLNILSGTVLSKGLVINPININSVSYTLNDLDLNTIGNINEDLSKFIITPDMDENNNNPDYMSLVSIDMIRIILKLSKI